MSSLAALAHHATAPALTASGIAFYATAATVTPVLFIAIAVQGQFQQDLLSGIAGVLRWTRQWMLRQPRSGPGELLQVAGALVGLAVYLLGLLGAGLLILFILLLGAAGEIFSIAALAPGLREQLAVSAALPGRQLEEVVALSVVLLALVAVAASVLALGKHAFGLARDLAAPERKRRAALRSEAPDDGGFF
jgi:hypothetical protein